MEEEESLNKFSDGQRLIQFGLSKNAMTSQKMDGLVNGISHTCWSIDHVI